ncbi:MAG: hypothetical protein BWY74_00973 [Firmicutes bacterium ADurb.Bin419]|nr:MAG: hypothetical protein BWY74_00973 [Firmicutes bacterium ADurb.Bin419]
MIYIIVVVNLLLTCIFEGIIIFFLFRKREYVYYSFLCNMLTNPVLNLLLIFLYRIFRHNSYYVGLIILELMFVLVEAYVYTLLCNFKVQKALLLSFLLNGVSYALGTVLMK